MFGLSKLGASLVAAGEEALAAAKAQAEQLENAFKIDNLTAEGGAAADFLPDGSISLASGVCVRVCPWILGCARAIGAHARCTNAN